MILYYGVTTYQFFCFMVHKLTEKSDEPAILLLPERINDADLLRESIQQTGIFEDVIKYKEFFPKSKKIGDNVIQAAIKESIDLVESYKIDFESFSDLYIASDHYSLGVYLNIKNIKYNFFEEGNGRLSTSNDVYEHLEKINPIRARIARNLKLFGFSENVIHRYGNLNVSKNNNYFDSRDINFDVSKRLATLTNEDIERIFLAFGVSKEEILEILDSNVRKQILLTQHYINMGLLSYESHVTLYRNLLDFFGDESSKLIIKPHPSDIHVDYKEIFPESLVLPRVFPAELLTVLDLRFTRGIAASSTSINSFSDIAEKIICFDQKIESDVNNFVKYFVCSELLKKIKIRELHLVGVNEALLNESVQISFDIDEGQKVWVVDKPAVNAFRTIQNIIADASKDGSIIVFLDTKKNSYFINNHRIEKNFNFFPLAIDQSNENSRSERSFIYIYSKHSKFFMELLNIMTIEKKLKYSGITIKVNPQCDTEIKIYEGINLALENRLADVTNAYKKLMKSQEGRAVSSVKLENSIQPVKKESDFNQTSNLQNKILEKILVRIITIGNNRKYKKYLRNREQYFKDGWFYRKFLK